MKRLLCIVGSMDVGGAETFLMKIYREIDKKKYQFDFCVAKKEKNTYEDEIIELGGKIFRITPKTQGFFKNFNDIKKIVKDNNYKYVLRISQNSLSAIELFAAKLGGAKILAFRSSNTSVHGGKIESIIHYLFRPIANMISNIKIAPSKEAANFMFGHRKYYPINNGLDLNKFVFSEEKREKYRKEFKVQYDTKVVGHVGRFTFQKNHKFLIDIFNEYQKINSDSELWLFGKGELEDEIKEYAKNNKKIKFMGLRTDINEIYSAMDCFVFPSLFEGMPNTIIEAQTAGLHCLVSNTVTKDCDITNNIDFLSLDDTAVNWANKITFLSNSERKNKKQLVRNKKYDIKDVTREFINNIFYDKNITNEK